MSLEEKAFEKLFQLVEKEVEKEMKKPFQVSIMGQTGVGKSSLLNSLFKTSLKTDDVKPCTKEIEKVSTKFDGSTVWFYDLPGIGESGEADERYLSSYREKLLESDVVLWAIHCDSRSVMFDLNSLHELLSGMKETEKATLVSKITFVLTKADLINHKPWMLAKQGKTAFFFPDKYVEQVLDKKIEYYAEVLAFFLQSKNRVTTFNDCNFDLKLPNFEVHENKIILDGILSIQDFIKLSTEFPQYKKVFERVSIKNKIIPCSSFFNYNLPRVLLAVADKIQGESNLRFKKFAEDITELDKVLYEKALQKFNLRVLDIQKEEVLFDANKNIYKI